MAKWIKLYGWMGLVLLLSSSARPAPTLSHSQLTPRDLCEMFGFVYLAKPQQKADYLYYVEESEFSADLVVFWQENPLYASSSGLWYETPDPFEAHYVLKETKSRSKADFIVYFTEYEHRAGCPY